MSWLVKVLDKSTGRTLREHYYRTETGAHNKIAKIIEKDPNVKCKLFKEFLGTFKQEELLPHRGVWDF